MRGRRGLVLLQVLGLSVLFGLWIQAILYSNVGLVMAGRQQEKRRRGRFATETAYQRAANCLAVKGVSNCVPPAGAACTQGPSCGYPCNRIYGTYDLTYPGSSDVFNVVVTVAGAANNMPGCDVTVRCNNCD